MAALRDSLSLAIPTLHGDCMDVSRGLRASGIPGSSNRNRENTIHGMAERAPCARLSVGRICADGFAARQSGVRNGNAAAQSGFPLLCRATRLNSLKPICAPAAFGLDPLSSLGVLASSTGKNLRK